MSNPSAGPPPYSADDEKHSQHATVYPRMPHEHDAAGYPPSPNMGPAAPYPASHPYPPHAHHHQPQPFVYVADPAYGPRPVHVTCPRCSQQVVTQVRYSPGLLAWLICAGCVIFGQVLSDAEHVCPNCNSYLGQYKRI
ncbi:Lipopolysaccharide-induced tumor necrosis factor-alpha factor [Aphelenchoides fujianensis]|nr:Lipopolysaccharide-induced tumor necrosis factor-alpha factor [Aphelenchoides fujianensis]